MEIKKGQDRIVLIIPKLNIVIKFPIIHLIEAIKYVSRNDLNQWLEIEFHTPIDRPIFSLHRFLFRGIVINWREFIFYLKTRNPFTQPTLFSFFGIFNIQLYGQLCKLEYRNVWCQFRKLTNDEILKDSHHFGNPNNFCINGGKLRIVDYGSRNTQLIISRNGENISRFFNPAHQCGCPKDQKCFWPIALI